MGKDVWIKYEKKQNETLCIVWSLTKASHSVSVFYKQLFIERWKVKETWVHERLIKEWEAGGCERHVMVFVWDKSLSTFLHLALWGYFSGIAEIKAQVGGVHGCTPARWFSSPEAPCGLRTGRGAETWARNLSLILHRCTTSELQSLFKMVSWKCSE